MKEKSNDKDIKSAAHARIQARGGQTGLVRKKNGGGKSKAGVVEQTRYDRITTQRIDKLTGADRRSISDEQMFMEISRLGAELTGAIHDFGLPMSEYKQG